jgi:hypothetical protein
MWVVHLLTAMICYQSQCYPVLVGDKTPAGVFTMVHMRTYQPGYGGDILAFADDRTTLYAVHRVWTLKPSQHRVQRLDSFDAGIRRDVTSGCVNVMPDVYAKILQSGERKLEVVRD